MSPLDIKPLEGRDYKINDPGDGVVGSALRTGEPYEAKVLYHIFREGHKGAAIDVGAHVGNHTLFFALACGLRVYSFEPVEYRKLMDNLKLNNLNGNNGKVRAWPVALGNKAGRARLISRGELGAVQVDGPGTVPVCVLDDFQLQDKISLIKIDVEGWEPEVLLGARNLIERDRPYIYAEARDELARKRNESVLKDMGYRHVATFGATPLEEWKYNGD